MLLVLLWRCFVVSDARAAAKKLLGRQREPRAWMDCGVWHRECLLIKGNFPLEALDFNFGPESRVGCGKILTGALLRRSVCPRIWGLWKWDLHRHLPESQRTTVRARDPHRAQLGPLCSQPWLQSLAQRNSRLQRVPCCVSYSTLACH